MAKSIHRSSLKEDMENMVILLSRTMRLKDSHEFEFWMFLFINIVCEGKKHIDWEELISDSLHRQLMELQANDYGYMTSYLFYAIASTKRWSRLNKCGTYDDAAIIYNHLHQLQYEGCLHHIRRVNDALMMLTVRELQGNMGLIISSKLAVEVQKYRSYFI